ncbi:4-hydroxy-tetrahydrodipicolinate reductase [Planctomycetota bacterium]|nr:4-hydroxy-tetrahydrodipicolinate reductase [Planctomycetota bacterium]
MKMAVFGALGRMGQRVGALGLEAGHELTAAIAVEQIGEDFLGVKLTEAYLGGADVLIDFSLPAGFEIALASAVEHGTAFVSGTTGLQESHFKLLDEAAGKIPLIWAPNYSLGVNMLFALARRAAKALPDTFDIEITEMHHRRKVDAPSGTALGLLNAICEGNGRDVSVARHGREGVTGERSRDEIGMHSLRGGSVVGDHMAIFAADGERLELSHRAETRDIFASGAIAAAAWLAGKSAGRYAMADVLGL